VTLTVPDCVAVNVRIAVPFCAIAPVSVSVEGEVGFVGVVGVLSLLLLHAAPSTANARSPASDHFMRAMTWVRRLQ